MKIQKTISTLIAAMALGATAVQAQDNLFKVSFDVNCKPKLSGQDNHISSSDLIRGCVGAGPTKDELNKNFKLVYNATADSIQVVNASDGSFFCDVFQFQPGTNVVGNNSLRRLVFVFVPGNPDAVGSAVMGAKSGKQQANGTIQFSHPSDGTGTNTEVVVVASDTSTNTRCTTARSHENDHIRYSADGTTIAR